MVVVLTVTTIHHMVNPLSSARSPSPPEISQGLAEFAMGKLRFRVAIYQFNVLQVVQDRGELQSKDKPTSLLSLALLNCLT